MNIPPLCLSISGIKRGEVLEKGQQKGRHINGGDLQKKVRFIR